MRHEVVRAALVALMSLASGLAPATAAAQGHAPEALGHKSSAAAPPAQQAPEDSEHGDAPAERELHPVHGKLMRFKDERGEFFYDYDAQGRLVAARRVEGSMARLSYDAQGYIQKLVIQDATELPVQELQFRYDKQGRIRLMELIGRGVIRASYDAAGEIQLSHPGLDRKDALTVFGMFGTMSMLTRPAGISINWRGL